MRGLSRHGYRPPLGFGGAPLRLAERKARNPPSGRASLCLGVQLLSRALGGEVYKLPVKETGFLEVEAVGKDPLLDPFAPRTRVFQFHEDTCTLPEGAELLFTGEDVAVQAFKAGERAYGVQFHFEITPMEISNWCDATPDLETEWRTSKQELLRQADDHLEQQPNRPRGSKKVHRTARLSLLSVLHSEPAEDA